MRAAVVREVGDSPEPAEIDEPEVGPHEVAFRVLAAPFNPIDLAIARGQFGGGHPPLPYVPGVEAVGRIEGAGPLHYVMGGGLGVQRSGTAAEWCSVAEGSTIEIRAEVAQTLAAGLGTPGLAAWLGIEWRGELSAGETVVVLGASGAAGTLALQIARLLGAGRVVGVGRDAPRLERVRDLADAVVSSSDSDYPQRLLAACPDGANLIVDLTWGAPLEGALTATAVGARVVQIGAAAGPIAGVSSPLVRGRQLSILGYTNFAVPRAVLTSTYGRMLDAAEQGSLTLAVDEYSLDDVTGAWAHLAAGRGKVVLTP